MIFRGVQTLTGDRILLLYYSTFVLHWGTAVPDRDRNRMVSHPTSD
ncbi:MAG TPA: hypothetical protein V6C85_16555 [Allocoleopsis sp.]